MIQEKIQTANAPKAIGPYSQGILCGDFVILSGQLPIDPKTQQLVDGDIVVQTKQVLDNIGAILAEVGLEYHHVLKATIYLTDMADFKAFNEVYAQYFCEPYPARSTVVVKELAFGAKIEIEVNAIDTRALEVICQQEGCQTCDESACCCQHEDE